MQSILDQKKNQGEINLKEFFNLLMSSTKLIFFVTIISILVALSPSVFHNPSFISSVKVKIGEYNNTKIVSNTNLSQEVHFLYDLVKTTGTGGIDYIALSSNSASMRRIN